MISTDTFDRLRLIREAHAKLKPVMAVVAVPKRSTKEQRGTKEQRRAWNKTFKDKNPERFRLLHNEHNRNWRQSHKEQVRIKKGNWRRANAERINAKRRKGPKRIAHRPEVRLQLRRERERAWRLSHKDEVRARNHRYHDSHADQINASKRAERQSRKEYILSRDREYYKKNVDRINARRRAARAKKREQVKT